MVIFCVCGQEKTKLLESSNVKSIFSSLLDLIRLKIQFIICYQNWKGLPYFTDKNTGTHKDCNLPKFNHAGQDTKVLETTFTYSLSMRFILYLTLLYKEPNINCVQDFNSPYNQQSIKCNFIIGSAILQSNLENLKLEQTVTFSSWLWQRAINQK